jgi:hypothetical protein
MTLKQLAEEYESYQPIDGSGFRCRARGRRDRRSAVRGQRIRQTAHCQLLLPTPLPALNSYRTHLTDEETFASWTLKEFVSLLQSNSKAPWISAFTDRYLAFEKIDNLLDSNS